MHDWFDLYSLNVVDKILENKGGGGELVKSDVIIIKGGLEKYDREEGGV